MVPCTPSAGFKEQFNFKKTMCLYQSSIKKTEALRNTLQSYNDYNYDKNSSKYKHIYSLPHLKIIAQYKSEY